MTDDTRPRSKSPKRFPTWIVIILGAVVGGLYVAWKGALLGGLMGTIIWLGRR